jgi:hypothetical protein
VGLLGPPTVFLFAVAVVCHLQVVCAVSLSAADAMLYTRVCCATCSQQ